MGGWDGLGSKDEEDEKERGWWKVKGIVRWHRMQREEGRVKF